MNRIIFNEDLGNMTESDIAWHNLKTSDDSFQLSCFISSIIGWLKINSTKNLQDLEKELRDKNFNTHLIARKLLSKDVDDGMKLGLPKRNDNVDYKYECLISCRPKEDAINELLKEYESYEDNFANLNACGMLEIISDTDNTGVSPKTYNISNTNDEHIELEQQEKSDMEKISSNKIKIESEKLTSEQFIKEHVSELSKQYENVETAVVGLDSNNLPILAFTSGKQIISNFGIRVMLEKDTNEKKMVIFNLR
jgi:hypothetical protein